MKFYTNYAKNRAVFRENLHSWHKFYTTACRDGRDKSQLCLLEIHYNLWSNFFSGVFPQAPIIPVKYYVAGAENNAIFWRKSSFSPPPSSIKSSQRSEQNCPFVVQKWDKALKTCCVAKCFQKKMRELFSTNCCRRFF